MTQFHFMVHYPGSYWGADQVIFDVSDTVSREKLERAILNAMEEILRDHARNLQERADQVFDLALKIVGGGFYGKAVEEMKVNIADDAAERLNRLEDTGDQEPYAWALNKIREGVIQCRA